MKSFLERAQLRSWQEQMDNCKKESRQYRAVKRCVHCNGSVLRRNKSGICKRCSYTHSNRQEASGTVAQSR